ncbi:MAG: LuxR C-terminal-related transcriptional regulator [Treponema sp.]|jgi:LuxR family maltose regulon positive regulatory protein|nr:LuxR C-terminal-related transcriptional regulator [Treponema sp.]
MITNETPADFLERPQVDSVLEAALRCPIVTVVAGAGFGKSFQVKTYLSKKNYTVIWTALSSHDNDPDLFWADFRAALIEGSGKPPLFTGRRFPASDAAIDQYVRTAFRQLRRRRYVLVFDNVHLLADERVLHFGERALRYASLRLSVILISRRDSENLSQNEGHGLNLVSFESRGLLGHVDQEDLYFSRRECADYFERLAIPLTPSEADAVYGDTEGWIFGMRLAATYKQSAPGAVYVSGVIRHHVFSFIDSLFKNLPPEISRFFIKLSLFDQHPKDLVRKLAGPALFQQFEHHRIFIHTSFYENHYRIHHLFLEYLRGLQNDLSGEERREVWRICADHAYSQGDLLIAINYLETAGDYDRIIDLFIDNFSRILGGASAGHMFEVLDRMPHAAYQSNPHAMLMRIWLLVYLNRLDEARKGLETEIARVLKRPAGTKADYITLAGAYLVLGAIVWMRSIYTAEYNYSEYIEKFYRYAKLGGYTLPAAATLFNVGAYVCRAASSVRGECERYIESFSKIIPPIAEILGGCLAGLDDLGRGEIMLYRGNLDKAEEHLLLAQITAKKNRQFNIENRAIVYLVRLYISRGDWQEINKLRGRLREHLYEKDYLNRREFFDMAAGWFYARLGMEDRVADWLKNDLEESGQGSHLLKPETLINARCHYNRGDYKKTIAVLAGLENPPVMGKIEILLLKALACFKMGDKSGAAGALAGAWKAAQPNGFLFPFTELGKDMKSLAEAFHKQGADAPIPAEDLERIRLSASAYEKRLALVAEHFQKPQIQNSSRQVTRSETAILRLFSQGYTVEEVSDESGLSENTLKSMIKRIYEKLGAANRADAIRIATYLDLISGED